MLKKKNRADRKTIEQIFKTPSTNGRPGHFVNSENLTFRFILNNLSKTPVISFLTPKGISKSAVRRNLLRRRGYAILKKYLDKLPKNLAGVFIFNKKSVERFTSDKNKNQDPKILLEHEIKSILDKIN